MMVIIVSFFLILLHHPYCCSLLSKFFLSLRSWSWLSFWNVFLCNGGCAGHVWCFSLGFWLWLPCFESFLHDPNCSCFVQILSLAKWSWLTFLIVSVVAVFGHFSLCMWFWLPSLKNVFLILIAVILHDFGCILWNNSFVMLVFVAIFQNFIWDEQLKKWHCHLTFVFVRLFVANNNNN